MMKCPLMIICQENMWRLFSLNSQSHSYQFTRRQQSIRSEYIHKRGKTRARRKKYELCLVSKFASLSYEALSSTPPRLCSVTPSSVGGAFWVPRVTDRFTYLRRVGSSWPYKRAARPKLWLCPSQDSRLLLARLKAEISLTDADGRTQQHRGVSSPLNVW